MSEAPERKVLKETLARLKTKNITSLNSYKANVKATLDNYKDLMNTLIKEFPQRQEGQSTILLMLGYILQDFERLIMTSLNTMEDLSIYGDTLESYSVGLDNTLGSIFEKAKQYAEEKTKEQEQLVKKDDSALYVK